MVQAPDFTKLTVDNINWSQIASTGDLKAKSTLLYSFNGKPHAWSSVS